MGVQLKISTINLYPPGYPGYLVIPGPMPSPTSGISKTGMKEIERPTTRVNPTESVNYPTLDRHVGSRLDLRG